MTSLLPRPVVSTEALVLRTWPSGETSLVASLLTAERGYVSVIAKSARKSRSSLRPLVQPGTLAVLEFTWQPDRDLQYLRGGALLPGAAAAGAVRTLEQSAFLLALVELADRCRPSDDCGEDLFGLCRDFVRALAVAEPGQESGLFYAFELALLDLQGLAPVLESCASCGRPAAELDLASVAPAAAGAWFSPAAGGLCCGECHRADRCPDSRALPGGALDLLRQFSVPEPLPAAAPPPREASRQVGILLHRFLAYHLPAYRLPAALDVLRPAGRRDDE